MPVAGISTNTERSQCRLMMRLSICTESNLVDTRNPCLLLSQNRGETFPPGLLLMRFFEEIFNLVHLTWQLQDFDR